MNDLKRLSKQPKAKVTLDEAPGKAHLKLPHKRK